MSVAPPQSGIDVKTGFRPLAFLLHLVKTRLALDGGEPVVRPWGDTFIPVPPGHHTVRCFFRYLYFAEAGNSTVTVDVGPGQIVSVTYRAPLFMFRPGKWQRSGPAPLGTRMAAVFAPANLVPASWLPDPSGLHQSRYWDGSTWTAFVADNGVTSVDRQ